MKADENFEIDAESVGFGTFSDVYMARDKQKDLTVALKRVKQTNNKDLNNIIYYGACREVAILKTVTHENIVAFKGVCPNSRNRRQFYTVLEYCDYDLLFVRLNLTLSTPEVKCLMRQLLEGLRYLHDKKIIHRDIKPGNILINKDGVLKVADFGHARECKEETNSFSNMVVTLCYRAPEMLLGERNYGPAIDVWSAACVMAEIITGNVLFHGHDENSQIAAILDTCGPISKDVWPGVELLPLFKEKVSVLSSDGKRRLKEKLMPPLNDDFAFNLLDAILAYDPRKRLSSRDALSHEFFAAEPKAEVDLRGVITRLNQLEQQTESSQESDKLDIAHNKENRRKRRRRRRKRRTNPYSLDHQN
ncbi:Hypothetical predicted protein [Cloeon dipterum]|uniref:Protein kinase domain-containing protein n=1 Tax=Cloeon dipterum TaxID=197152 RepID=A0A8S1CCX4_9INSE|nr:Hypothetical predicted protein [Cloeon dipterum]